MYLCGFIFEFKIIRKHKRIHAESSKVNKHIIQLRLH